MFIQISRPNFSLQRIHPFFSFPSSSWRSKLNKYSLYVSLSLLFSLLTASPPRPPSHSKNEWESTVLFFFLLDRSVELLCSFDLKFFANNQPRENDHRERSALEEWTLQYDAHTFVERIICLQMGNTRGSICSTVALNQQAFERRAFLRAFQ